MMFLDLVGHQVQHLLVQPAGVLADVQVAVRVGFEAGHPFTHLVDFKLTAFPIMVDIVRYLKNMLAAIRLYGNGKGLFTVHNDVAKAAAPSRR